MAAVARTITDDQLASKTPCTEYDVRALVNHLLFWGPSLAGAGRKESVPQPAAAESDVDLATGDWRSRLLGLLAHLHDAMSAGVEQGREMGLYGPEVAVPAEAPTLDRILGLTGRDPAWA